MVFFFFLQKTSEKSTCGARSPGRAESGNLMEETRVVKVRKGRHIQKARHCLPQLMTSPEDQLTGAQMRNQVSPRNKALVAFGRT